MGQAREREDGMVVEELEASNVTTEGRMGTVIRVLRRVKCREERRCGECT